jgi:large subunit ribosomal protein L13
MLPWKKSHGKDAFHRVVVYVGIPKEYEGKTYNTVSHANASKLRVPFITVAQLAEEIGGIPA